MLVTKSFTFDAAHRLLHHQGKCHNLHGHTYKIEVTVNGPVKQYDPQDADDIGHHESDEGMVIDFDRIKEWWSDLDPIFDHALILDENDPLIDALESLDNADAVKITQLPFSPTAENFAQYFKDHLADWLVEMVLRDGQASDEIEVVAVRVYETPTSWAEA